MTANNCRALDLNREQLPDAYRACRARRQAMVDERQRRGGASYIFIPSFMENIGWPELLQYDMNRMFQDSAFALETELRQRIFWDDNVDSDSVPELRMLATTGMYFDMELFGQQVVHTPQGVPEFMPHPLAKRADLKLIPADFDFFTSGSMPRLHAQYRELKQLATEWFGEDRFQIDFPRMGRGPLDIAVQMRGYENFVMDAVENPAFVRDFLALIVVRRARYNRERRAFLGENDTRECGIDDDWVNVPLLSPAMIREFAIPAYRAIRKNEGRVIRFHTCGNLLPVIRDLLEVFPELSVFEISPWNDIRALDEIMDPQIPFCINVMNTICLSNHQAEQRDLLDAIKAVSQHRRIASVCAAAIVKLYPTYEETLERLNRFLVLARRTLGNHE